eukprot:10266855-Alexandrium_andersonii.AAC.1
MASCRCGRPPKGRSSRAKQHTHTHTPEKEGAYGVLSLDSDQVRPQNWSAESGRSSATHLQ